MTYTKHTQYAQQLKQRKCGFLPNEAYPTASVYKVYVTWNVPCMLALSEEDIEVPAVPCLSLNNPRIPAAFIA